MAAVMDVYIPLEVPAHLVPYLAGELAEGWAPAAMVPAGLAEAGVARVTGWSAAICDLIRTAPRGATPAEVVDALRRIGCPEHGLMIRVRNAIDFYDRHRVLAKRYEIVQERRDQQDDVLRPVLVIGPGPGALGFEPFGGFREPNCPKAFRGEIAPDRLHIGCAQHFVANTVGPITRHPAFLAIRQRGQQAMMLTGARFAGAQGRAVAARRWR